LVALASVHAKKSHAGSPCGKNGSEMALEFGSLAL